MFYAPIRVLPSAGFRDTDLILEAPGLYIEIAIVLFPLLNTRMAFDRRDRVLRVVQTDHTVRYVDVLLVHVGSTLCCGFQGH